MVFNNEIKNRKGLLIIMGGLPGTGKASIAKELSLKLNAVYLRIDTIEQALPRQNLLKTGEEGYLIAYAIAEENLRLNNIVVADSVNLVDLTRTAWHNVATKTNSDFLEIEVICSDKIEHKRRIENRKADIQGHVLPTWDQVINREYHIWQTKNLTIDTAKQNINNTVEQIFNLIH